MLNHKSTKPDVFLSVVSVRVKKLSMKAHEYKLHCKKHLSPWPNLMNQRNVKYVEISLKVREIWRIILPIDTKKHWFFFIVEKCAYYKCFEDEVCDSCLNEWIPEKIQGPKRPKPRPIQKINVYHESCKPSNAYRCDKIKIFWGTIETCQILLKMRPIKKLPKHIRR